MSLRLNVVLPVAVAFAFGAACGVVVAYVAWKAPQAVPQAAAPEDAGQAAAAAGQDGGGAQDEDQLRRMLAVHEELLAKSPDDVALIRTVGNYHAALRQNEAALERYEAAERAARAQAKGDAEVAAVVADQGIVLAEVGRLGDGIAKLEEAARLDPKDVRSRLVQVYLYLTRVMRDPPPGFERREAIRRSEALLSEVLALDPQNADALQFQELISSVRSSMGQRGASPATGP